MGIVILTNNDNQSFFEALRYQLLDAYLGVPYVNRSQAMLAGFKRELAETAAKTNELKARVKSNNPPQTLDNYVGTYYNSLYGNIEITKDETGKFLNIDFKGHNTLQATVKYMDNNEWLLEYNNIGYGLFPVKFQATAGQPLSIDIKVNDFLDYDSYTFSKK